MDSNNEHVQELTALALTLGVDEVEVVDIDIIRVEDRLAAMCASPACPSYGLAPSCPPHLLKPEAFRRMLPRFDFVLVFKIEVPTDVLLGEGRNKVARRIHEIAAEVELRAKKNGQGHSLGLAAGSCKEVFCKEAASCVVLSKESPCLYADSARTSISGYGINVVALCDTLGWNIEKVTKETKAQDVPMGMMLGMVFIG